MVHRENGLNRRRIGKPRHDASHLGAAGVMSGKGMPKRRQKYR
jgi:hypothetical protein